MTSPAANMAERNASHPKVQIQRSPVQKMLVFLASRLSNKLLKRLFLCLTVILVVNWIVFARTVLEHADFFKQFETEFQRRHRQVVDSGTYFNLKERSLIISQLEKDEKRYVKCSTVNTGAADTNDWVYVSEREVHIHEHVQEKYGEVSCDSWPVVRREQFEFNRRPRQASVKHVLFFVVNCSSENGTRYQNVHPSDDEGDDIDAGVRQATTGPAANSKQSTTDPVANSKLATTGPAANSKRATTGPAANSKQATTGPAANSKQATTGPGANSKRATTGPAANSKRATTGPAANSKRATTGPTANSKQATTGPAANSKRATTGPAANSKRATTGPAANSDRQATTSPNSNAIHSKAEEKQKPGSTRQKVSREGLASSPNVLIIVVDGLSRATWRRSLPLTTSYITRALDGKEFNNYNVSWHGEPAALLPILTGKMQEELSTAGRSSPETAAYPWIWEEFRSRAYITAFAQDDLGTAKVERDKMKIFKSQPVDYSVRVFAEDRNAIVKLRSNACFGVMLRRKLILDWIRDMFDAIGDVKSKFFVGFLRGEDARSLDEDLRQFFMDLKEQGHLDSSLIILTSDNNLNKIPYLALSVPASWFLRIQSTYAMRNMGVNVAATELVTPFDIHETLRDWLTFQFRLGVSVPKYPRGISVLREMPERRSCAHAGVAPQWCTSLPWQQVTKSPDSVQKVAQHSLEEINIKLSAEKAGRCAELKLLDFIDSYHYSPSPEERQAAEALKKSMGNNAVVAVTNGTDPFSMWSESDSLIKVSFFTEPGDGLFESIYSFNLTTGQKGLVINRINSLLQNPDCLHPRLSHLKPFCYCKTSGKGTQEQVAENKALLGRRDW